jgi:hypothetical protein
VALEIIMKEETEGTTILSEEFEITVEIQRGRHTTGSI